MKQCKYEGCKKEFNPQKPKAVYCSAKCRVYGNRAANRNKAANEAEIMVKTDRIAGMGNQKSNLEVSIPSAMKTSRPPMPVKMPGENPLDYAMRKNEWKRG